MAAGPDGERSFIFVTCGDWDLKTMLPKQCDLSRVKVPKAFSQWINLKIAFGDFFKKARARGMTEMLEDLDIPLVGRHHSGIDDARNIAAVMMKMLKQGYVATPTAVSAAGRPAHPKAPSSQGGDVKGKGKSKEMEVSNQVDGTPGSASAASASTSPKSQVKQPKQKAPMARSLEETYDGAAYGPYHLVDIGANLAHHTFDRDMPGLLRRSLEGGVKHIITLGASVHSSLQCQSLCAKYNNADGSGVALRYTAGVHPHDAKTCDGNTIAQLIRMARDPNMVAIGECGLDFDRNFSPPDVQERWFEEQVKLAIQLQKPLYLHERSAHTSLVRILSKVRPDSLSVMS